MKIISLLGFFIIAATIVYLGVSLYIAYVMTEPNISNIKTARETVSENGENVEFKASDNIVLKGWFFSRNKSKKAVILVHGLGENRVNSYYGGIEIARFLLNEGYNVLMYDTRGNGESQAVRLTYGSKDGRDVIGAINYLVKRGYERKNIAILATSLGAISTIMVVDEVKDVGAIILDSPATILEPLTTRELTTSKKIPYLFVPGIYFMGKTVLGVDILSVRPVDTIKRDSKRNFLFFHGEMDEFVPVKDSQILLSVSQPKSRLVIFKNAKHVETFKSNPELYKNEVIRFLESELK